jgi:hypothetical protein
LRSDFPRNLAVLITIYDLEARTRVGFVFGESKLLASLSLFAERAT